MDSHILKNSDNLEVNTVISNYFDIIRKILLSCVAEKGEMTMALDHFSIYTIVDEEPVEDKESSYPIFICLAIIVVICLGILLPQVVGRKQ